MLTKDKKRLLIFERFEVDRNLPKYKPREKSDTSQNRVAISDFGSFMPSASTVVGGSGFSDNNGDWIDQSIDKKIEISKRAWKRLFDMLFFWIPKWLIPKRKPKLSVTDFFKNVKSNMIDIEVYNEKVNHFIKIAEHAKESGQVALYEEVMQDVAMIKAEAILLAGNFKTCITEQQIIDFYKDSDKGLNICYIKNFGRVIPAEAINEKKRADELLIFDNYVVLFYDKTQKTYKQTLEEKDPIIFGIITGVNKLYYITDWVDEYCDLTLKQLVDKFGEDAIKANDLTVNYKKPQVK